MPNTSKIQIVKYAPPPPELPIYGRENSAEVSFIGRTNYVAALEEKKFIFGIKRSDRRRNVYVIGKSAVGKSKLLELLIRQDIAYGHGLCLIDPYGDLADSILDFIPEERVEDVVFLDFSDEKHTFFFNPLVGIDKNLKHQAVEGLIITIKKFFGASWSHKLEYIFRFICLALLDYPEATMRSITLMLTDASFREKVLGFVQDEIVKHFWVVEFQRWFDRFEGETAMPLLNKFAQFISDPVLGKVFAQKENRINFIDFISQKKIVLINLTKEKLGEENSSFLGALFVLKLKEAMNYRAFRKDSNYEDFYIYIDEFHNLVSEIFEQLVSEARKYKFCLTLSHQYLKQLSPTVQSIVLGNAGTIIVFRVSGEDALRLEPELSPMFKVKDMINLGVQEFYIKITINGETYDPFSAETLKVFSPAHESFRGKIITVSKKVFANPSNFIEASVKNH
ncbi:MAG: TraM recognition domain-containing protein [Patescibacteria group bacterium]|nr:TraM recognition domain-containing protein [Patescibacteria group bacterium]